MFFTTAAALSTVPALRWRSSNCWYATFCSFTGSARGPGFGIAGSVETLFSASGFACV
jgi:hypothetical protein